MLTWYLIIDDREHEPEYHITEVGAYALAYASQLAGQHPARAKITLRDDGVLAEASIGGVHVRPVRIAGMTPARVREARDALEWAQQHTQHGDAEAKE